MGFGREQVEVRVENLKNGKAAGKDKITGDMIKVGGDSGELDLEAMRYGLSECCA